MAMSEKTQLVEKPNDMTAEVPAETGIPGTPDKLFFLQSSSGDFSDELRVLDLSSSITFSTFEDATHDEFYAAVEKAAKNRQNDRAAWVYELTRKSFSSNMQIHDSSNHGVVAAELDLSILKHYGTWKLSFPQGSRHSSHDLEIKPVSILQKQETFVKDGTMYIWDMTMGGKRGELYKTINGKKALVAAFAAKSWFKNNCVLVMDTKEVGDVVVVGSCVAALNRDI
ncbi:hypothetical protein VFPPC_00033 [Pochonia chlamydosporia 170]|uniref:Uncharacterized protein n=1 Tax=Pochonia chlamydosporia 170 TaxID=1380566 RepID=A0A179G250_METCM|nr:hypothetical protein VFPPC_00033 [Pochonia chlamydosporia 170]OAQ71955.1 hypothetical protein VFPPC_00033 [Pochonia chlamydosporia 170]